MTVKNQDDFDAQNRDRQAAFEKSERYRFQEQCFLNFWKAHIFRELAQYHSPLGTQEIMGRRNRPLMHGGNHLFGSPAKTVGTGGAYQGRNIRLGSDVYQYNHICTLDSTKPSQIVSMLNKKDGADVFFNLDSSILTQLKPVVRLYKVFPSNVNITPRDNQPPTTNDKISSYKVEMPLGENIKKDQEDMPSRANMSSLEELFADHDVLGNVMLTNLSFKFAGQNVALLNTVEDVSFTLSFSSFNLFTHLFKTTTTVDGNDKHPEWSYQDLISYSNRYTAATRPPALGRIDSERPAADLSCYETSEQYAGPSAADIKLNEQYNQKHFEIQMVVGYDPDDIDWNLVDQASVRSGGQMRLNEEERKALRSFLRTSAVVLRLQFVGHTISYNPSSSGADPELVIDFEYKAFIESSLNSPEMDLLKLPGNEYRKILEWENKLYQARRLLIAAKRSNKGLNEIFGETGQVGSNLQTQYSSLRKALDTANPVEGSGRTAENPLQWLIWSPVVRGGTSLALRHGLIPTKRQIGRAENPRSLPRHRTVRGGLEDLYDPENPETILGSTTAAARVFEELVEKISQYVKVLRRGAIREKYNSFLTALYAQERVYALTLTAEEVQKEIGWRPATARERAAARTAATPTAVEGGNVESTTAMAKKRASGTSTTAVLPGDIAIVRSTINWDASTRTTPQTSLNKALEEVNENFQAINLKRMDRSVSQNTATVAQEIQSALGQNNLNVPSGDGNNIVFFTNLGDIIDTAIAIASYPDYGLFKKRLQILLGPMLEEDKSRTVAGTKYLVNLAWIPVSLKSFLGFFVTKVLAGGKERYLLNDFIKDLIQDLILPALGSRCVEDAQEGNKQVGTITFTSEMRPRTIGGQQHFLPPFYPDAGVTGNPPAPVFPLPEGYPPGGSSAYKIDNATTSPMAKEPARVGAGGSGWEAIKWAQGGKLDNLTEISPSLPIDKQFNYMFIYINNISPTRLDPRNEAANIANGVYYLHSGQIPSIVKQTTFRKENQPYVREARAMGQLTRTGGVALRDVYHISCIMYGNNIFKPGMLFFVDPTKDGSTNYDAWRYLGLVGFYRVVEVGHQINGGNNVIHETSLTAKWETFGACEDGDLGLINTEFQSIATSFSATPTLVPITGGP